MIIQAQYKGYNYPKNNDICVGMCFFNPVGYKKPLSNTNTIIQQFKKYHIPFYVIELLYPGQTQSISDAIVVHANSILFAKENLWNVLEKKIPDNYHKIIFMDSDILYSDPDWLDKSSNLLDDNNVIQPMELTYKDIINTNDCVEIDTNNLIFPQNKICFAKAIVNGDTIDLTQHHPGYALGISRDFFHNIGGFFEHCITGSGDLAFWSGLIPHYKMDKHHLHSNVINKYIKYKDNLYKYYIYKNNISYLKNCVALHMYHGHKNNRQYNDRQKYLPIYCEYYYNQDGVLELKEVSVKDNNHLINYWIKRKEDE